MKLNEAEEMCQSGSIYPYGKRRSYMYVFCILWKLDNTNK